MNYTLLNTYGSPESAYIDAGMLQTNGIRCRVLTSAGSDLFPAPDGGPGTTQLFVEASQADEAAKIIHEHAKAYNE